MMELGADGVFVGSGVFKSDNPEKFAKAIVEATTHYQDYELIGKLAKELGTAMKASRQTRHHRRTQFIRQAGGQL